MSGTLEYTDSEEGITQYSSDFTYSVTVSGKKREYYVSKDSAAKVRAGAGTRGWYKEFVIRFIQENERVYRYGFWDNQPTYELPLAQDGSMYPVATDWRDTIQEFSAGQNDNGQDMVEIKFYTKKVHNPDDAGAGRNYIAPTRQMARKGGLEDEARAAGAGFTPRDVGPDLRLTMEPGLTDTHEHLHEQAMTSAKLNTPRTTLYVASMSKAIVLEGATGLIGADSFRLKWNNLEAIPDWDPSTHRKWLAIQKGDAPGGSIGIIKENLYLPVEDSPDIWNPVVKYFNTFSSLNTGKQQEDPTLSRIAAETPTFEVSYNPRPGAMGETKGLKDKYQRFEGATYHQGVDLAINTIVEAALKGTKLQSKYNFKKADTNKKFNTNKLSLFSEAGRMPESVEVSTTTATTTRPMRISYP